MDQVGRFTMEMIKVSANSRTSAVAGAIAGVFRENKRAEIQAIGAGAVNQAVKALVLSRGYLAEDGYELTLIKASFGALQHNTVVSTFLKTFGQSFQTDETFVLLHGRLQVHQATMAIMVGGQDTGCRFVRAHSPLR